MAHVHSSPQDTLKAIAATLGLIVLGATVAQGAQARTSCSYVGAPTNALHVRVSGEDGDGEIRRRGLEISVNEFRERAERCAGGTPTVLNTDTINVETSGSSANATLRLGGGPLAPGATPETVGASEIEVLVRGREPLLTVVGTSRGDEFHWGPGERIAGLNVNPGSAGDQDVDVTIEGVGPFTTLVADGAGGNDTIIAEPGARVLEGVFSDGGPGNDVLRAPRSGAILEGGPGNDQVVGAGGIDFLEGGPGRDRVTGGGGPDRITGGPGRDRLFGGAGGDVIKSRDSARDTVRCGSGRDRVTADRRDGVRGCERIVRR